ncbi:MAG: alanine--tRNA ligase [Thermoplasmata archaeon]|nr:alanine--tRNA ligase [Thermoplasmata archaeon]
MDPSEYDLKFFHQEGFHRRACQSCGAAFWALGDLDRCQEEPCTPYSFIGASGFNRALLTSEMRETFLSFFEKNGHTRIRRYPIVARWRNDVFFTQASIYDFQPWVTSGQIPPPANPLTISQPCLRLNDLQEIGRSSRYFSQFEMMAHLAFNRPGHEVYFKDRTTELCHGLFTRELGADPRKISYKEEEWEGGGNLGPSLSVGLQGLELATLVFMEYVRDGDQLKPMPLTVVDTGYGLERSTWLSQGTPTAYEAVFGEFYDELRTVLLPHEAAILADHARAVNFLITDGVVPSNAKEGYYARLLIRRMLRILARAQGSPDFLHIIDRSGREIARSYPEVGANRDDLHRVLQAEVERYEESIKRGRVQVRRMEERLEKEGRRVGVEDLVDWYDSLGLPPDVAVEELRVPPTVPDNFYALVADRHAADKPEKEYSETGSGLPEPPTDTPATEVLYYLDPYTLSFRSHVLWSHRDWVVLDRTFFYPTGGGQITDTGRLGEVPVVEVARRGPWVLHHLERAQKFRPGEEVHGHIDADRRRQLMAHHTATHILNGALRSVLGPHVWQSGAFKGTDVARIDITHYRPLSMVELREVERLANRIVSENRPVKSYFESRTEAERRFGFTLYQGGAVPGKELRIVEVEGFDVEACGGTHCTHTSEVGAIQVLDTDRIQDGVVRLSYVAGDRAVIVREERDAALHEAARLLAVPPEKVPTAVSRLLAELEEIRRAGRQGEKRDLGNLAEELEADTEMTGPVGTVTLTVGRPLPVTRAQLQELSRQLTRLPGRVAILPAESEGRGILFVGSSSPAVPADLVLEAMRPLFDGKGGGNSSAATAQGDPGEPLLKALAAGRESVTRLARHSSG